MRPTHCRDQHPQRPSTSKTINLHTLGPSPVLSWRQSMGLTRGALLTASMSVQTQTRTFPTTSPADQLVWTSLDHNSHSDSTTSTAHHCEGRCQRSWLSSHHPLGAYCMVYKKTEQNAFSILPHHLLSPSVLSPISWLITLAPTAHCA